MANKITNVMGGKCGCVTCRNHFTVGTSPVTSRSFWMGQKNVKGRSFGKFKPGKSK